jgi:hypothetical protein
LCMRTAGSNAYEILAVILLIWGILWRISYSEVGLEGI